MKKVVIIGGGVIGLCCAYYAARDGHAVTVIDRVDAEHEGCSYGNAGMVVPSHFVPLAAPGMVALGLKWMWNPRSPFYIKPRLDGELMSWALKFWQASTKDHVTKSAPLLRDLSFASREAFEELSREFDFGLVKKGLLMLCKAEHTLEEESKFATEAERLGVPAKVLSAKEASELDKGVTMDIAGAIYFPKDCHLAPGRFMAGLKSKLVAMGVKFIWDTDVTGFSRDGNKIKAAKTSTNEIEGDEFVIAGGSWSPQVARGLDLKLPIQAGKGYSVTLPKPRQLPELCAILTEARVAVTPIGSALRFGGTMEIAGLNTNINPIRVEGIVNSAQRYYPEFKPSDFEGVKPWCGLRPCSPDGLPYVGRTSQWSNVSIATGHAMMGLSLGPVTGRLVADALAGRKTEFDDGLLNPDRYSSR